MNSIEHLTEEQLHGYLARSLEREESHRVGRHLLQCDVCLKAMPAPTREQFLSALFGDEEFDEQQVSPVQKHIPSTLLPFSTTLPFFWRPTTLAWSAGALILVLSFTFFAWRAGLQYSNGGETAQSVSESDAPAATKESGIITPTTVEETVTASNDESPKNEISEAAKPSSIKPRPKPSIEVETNKISGNSEDKEIAALINKTPEAVSSLRSLREEMVLRGEGQGSNSAPTFALIFPVGQTVTETEPTFRWEKAAGATSYRISILDQEFNEVLTARVSENSFKPDKPLKRGEKYLWSVTAQTEKGEIISPRPPQPPAVFRIAGEKVENRIQSLNKNERDRFKLATLYAKEGMLDSAACALKDILTENPKHRAARRLLVKVEQWRKENQTTVQRCGLEPTAKTNQ